MKNHLYCLVLLLAITFILFGCQKQRPPKAPTISAPSTGNTNIPVNFTVQTTDPNKDDIAYLFNWGDGTSDSWTTYYPSGQNVFKTHAYLNPGNYDVMVKAKDIKNKESDWSTAHRISISSQAPNTPSTPSGPTSGWINIPYNFSTSTTDPDGIA